MPTNCRASESGCVTLTSLRAVTSRADAAQALALGLADDPAVQDVLRCVQEHTEALELLKVQQQDGTAPRKWWMDGEYDDERADAANDAGACRCP